MIDENAYGVLISYFAIEDEEYALERDEFIQRLKSFQKAWQACVNDLPLGDSPRAFDLGHAVYLELAEDDLTGDPLTWLREARARLSEAELDSVGVLSYGGRWLAAEDAGVSPTVLELESTAVHQLALPSEPLRHALDADSAARMTLGDEVVGWGPGLYVETDAIEALGRKLKNAPTPLEAGGATFYRIGR
jgi:hypothetical protein